MEEDVAPDPATEAFDRGEKWARYQTWLPELTDYLLVSQTKPRIDHFHRGAWCYPYQTYL